MRQLEFGDSGDLENTSGCGFKKKILKKKKLNDLFEAYYDAVAKLLFPSKLLLWFAMYIVLGVRAV